MDSFKLVNYLVPILTFLFGVLYNLYRLRTNDRAITKKAFNSQQTHVPAGAPVPTLVRKPASKPKSNTASAITQSSNPIRTSISVTETMDVLGKWVEELETEAEHAQKKTKRKFLGGLFGEREVVESFKVKDKTVRFL